MPALKQELNGLKFFLKPEKWTNDVHFPFAGKENAYAVSLIVKPGDIPTWRLECKKISYTTW